ncbi:hypothetical protein [Clostridium estertheticum]|uniref:hypothetical protein n=1 Tax=Clostridium estertheticum TaxID=238834 RepID=UPI001C0BC1BC|nr:hypothetical protein [Clostridium estertheticum]MBU3187682.1 hypothetical protein [Clostridium estertheticum]
MNNNVVIVCISGRSGSNGPTGMTKIRDMLRNELAPLEINPENIFRRSWNHNQDDNPAGIPDVNDINSEIDSRTDTPSYLAIIGHSYGGWAACRVSKVTNRVPDFVGIIDPVFGFENSMGSDDIPRGSFIKNWYQNNSIINGDTCTGLGKIPCSKSEGGFSCGYQNVEGATNIQEEFMKDWNGNRKRVSCVGGRKHVLTSHIDIDEDDWIYRQIRDQLYSDLSRIINKSPL